MTPQKTFLFLALLIATLALAACATVVPAPTTATQAPATKPASDQTAKSDEAAATATPAKGQEDAQVGKLPRFEPLDDCFAAPPEDVEGSFDVDCGYVVVPEFHQQESDRELKLGIMRFNSGEGESQSPLFILAGGPGQSLIGPIAFSLMQPGLLGDILQTHDVVFIDQRGVKHTAPYLDCPDYFSAPWAAYQQGLNEEETKAFEDDILQKCIEDFKAQGVDFDAFNSVENAADVNAMREALGYDKIIYWGGSYGAQLGQHVMRDFPDMLEAVILDGANPLSRKSWVEDRALDAQWGIDNLTKLCQEDEKCKETYDIPALVAAALALFDDGPVPYTYTDPDDESLTVDVEVTKKDLVNFIYEQQGTGIGAFSLPLILQQMTEAGVEATAEILGTKKAQTLIASRDLTSGGMALLMHMAMVCSDDPVKSVDDVVITDDVGEYAELFGKDGGELYTRLCSLIDVAELPDSTDVNVTVDVPTLLLSGSLDVATPTFRTQMIADALPNATLIVFPGRTHVQLTGINLCATHIMPQFVNDPTAPLDTSCTEENAVTGFPLPDGSMSQGDGD